MNQSDVEEYALQSLRKWFADDKKWKELVKELEYYKKRWKNG